MKKKIIIAAFILLIIITAVCTIAAAVYDYNIDSAGGVDIMEGLGAVLIMIVGGFAVFYEFDLFFTVYYFFVMPKTAAQSILHILSNLCLVLIFFADRLAYMLNKAFGIFDEDWLLPIVLFFIYIAVRIACIGVSMRENEELLRKYFPET